MLHWVSATTLLCFPAAIRIFLRPDFFRTSFPSLSRSSSARCPSVFPLPLLFVLPLLYVSVFVDVYLRLRSPGVLYFSAFLFCFHLRLSDVFPSSIFLSAFLFLFLRLRLRLVLLRLSRLFLPPFFWCLLSSFNSVVSSHLLSVSVFRCRLLFPSLSF